MFRTEVETILSW